MQGVVKDGKVQGAHNLQAQAWLKDAEALEQLAQRFSELMDEARAEMEESGQKNNTHGVRYAKNESFSDQIDGVLNNTYDRNNLIYMGNTPVRLQQIIGLNKLPMLITPKHVYSICVSKAKAISEKRFSHKVLSKMHFHNLGKTTLSEIPELLNKPLMIIKSTTKIDDSRVIIVLEKADNNGKPIVVALEPNLVGHYINVRLSSNFVLSAYGKDRIINYVNKANDEGRILYVNKSKNSQQRHNAPGVQFPDRIMSADYSNSLTRYRSIVNGTFKNIYEKKSKDDTIDADYLSAVERGDMETAQRMVDEAAERAFADSKVRDEDGKLLKVYHGSDADFTVFDKTKGRANMDIQGMFFSPWELDASGYGQNVRAFYLNVTNPASESTGYKALNRHMKENNAGVKAREDLERMGYDGVNNEDEEFIAFSSEQIKSADPVTYDDDGDVIPLSERFKTDNKDIRYSKDDTIDADYISAVERGDTETVQRIVDEETIMKQLSNRGLLVLLPIVGKE